MGGISTPIIQIGEVISGGTPGSVLFVGAAGDVQQDSTNFNYDNVAKALGIRGIAFAALSVDGNTSSSRIHVRDTGGGTPQIVIEQAGGGAGSASMYFFGGAVGGQAYFGYRNGFNIGTAAAIGGAISPVLSFGATGSASLSRALYLAQDTGAFQAVSGMYGGNGAPNNANGNNGDFYMRGDGAAGTFIYHKAAGAWTAFA